MERPPRYSAPFFCAYFFYYAGYCVFSSFIVLYLTQRGMSATLCGVITSPLAEGPAAHPGHLVAHSGQQRAVAPLRHRGLGGVAHPVSGGAGGRRSAGAWTPGSGSPSGSAGTTGPHGPRACCWNRSPGPPTWAAAPTAGRSHISPVVLPCHRSQSMRENRSELKSKKP